MNCLYKILPVLFIGLLLFCPLLLTAQAPTYNLSWYKTSCNTSVGTPTEVRIDITPFSVGTSYTCELYANPNPLGGQSSNPALGAILETYNTATNDATIDAYFTTTAYRNSYYIKVYPSTNPSLSTVQYIDVQRLAPSRGSYVANVYYNVTTTPQFCSPSAANMDITLSTSGTTVGHSFLWSSPTGAVINSPNSQNPTVPIYISGNSGPKHQYQVQIMDVAGCAKIINNIEYTPIQPNSNWSVNVKPFGFYGQECADIGADIPALWGNSSYAYHWYNNDGSLREVTVWSKIEYLEPGNNFHVEIKTGSGCLIQTLHFQTPEAISCSVGAITGDPCAGGSASNIVIDALFGTAPYTYEVTGVSPNTCHTIISNASSSITIGSMICDGTITPEVPVGAYEVKITDSLGCEFTKMIQVGQNINDLELEITTVDEVCDGNDGSFRIEPNGLIGNLAFNIISSPPSNSNPVIQLNNNIYEVSGLTAGSYVVEISLDGGIGNNYCTRTEVITINNKGIALVGTQVSSAQGSANLGTIMVNVSGAPLGDIEFQWSSQTTNNPYGSTSFGGLGSDGFNELSELGADTYTVTITYENCTLVETFVVPYCALVATGFSSPDRCQLSVGQVGVSVKSNGTHMAHLASYQWEQILPSQRPVGITDSVVNNVQAGTYSVTITYGGCSVVEQVIVGTGAIPMTPNEKDAYCGGNNGEADFSLHQLAWRLSSSSIVWTDANHQPMPSGVVVTNNDLNTGVDLQTTAKNLPVGSYLIHIEVTSLVGRTCSYIVKVNIKANSTPPSYTITTSPAICGSNGIVSVQGASYPIGSSSSIPTYTWMPLAPLPSGLYVGETVSPLPEGAYQLDATYGYYSACNHRETVTLPSINPTLVVEHVQNEGCGGTGEFRVSTNLEATHHTYSYVVTDVNTNLVVAQSSNGLFSNMLPGEYTVTLNTNNANCPNTSVSITIERSELVVLNQQNATCGTGGKLEVDLQDENGQTLAANNSDFVWSNGVQNRINNNLTQGTYTVTATQSNGLPCVATFLVVNTPLTITSEAITHACTGVNGSITLTTNDIGTVNYTWSNGSSGNSISGLSPGEYEVTITGTNNNDGTCVLYKSYTIYSGFDLTTNAEDVLCNGDNNGKIQAFVSNTNAPIISYVWSNNVYSPSQNNVSGGTYIVTVTDANSCTSTSSATVNEPNVLTINNFQPYSGTDPQIACGGEVQVSGGTGPYVVGWQLLQVEQQDDGAGNLVDVVIGSIEVAHTQVAQAGGNYTENKLAPGIYSIVVTDKNNCQVTSSSTIEITRQSTTLPTMYFRWEKQDGNGVNIITDNTPDETEIKAKVIADNMETQIKAAVDQFSDALNENRCDKVDDIADKTQLSYDLKYHHYTLYYYNRRGELTRTVPPAGVDFLTGTEITEHKEYRNNQTQTVPSKVLPNHTLVTTYAYDAAGRSIESTSPDAGLVKQAFRSDGLVRFSQDARQEAFIPERMTYIKYDRLNRVIEQGEMEVPNGSYATYITGQGQTDRNTLDFPQDIPTINKTEWVKTHYSDKHILATSPNIVYATYHGIGVQEQRYLRNRVSYTEAWNGGSNEDAITTTTYSYDPHGNVEWIRTYIPGLGDNYIRMEYDLISRNVNKVCYNELAIDRFYHRYEYDEQNRIINVETSQDDIVWDSDARYAYYEHGPLKRKEIGDDKIQGIDYTYTIHGWLKAINHPYLDKYENGNTNTTKNQLNDPGQDGYSSNTNNDVQKDVWGFSLGYYQGDYARQSNNGTGGYNSINEAISYNSQELYNGNITYWSNGTTESSSILNDQEKLTQRSFSYDNLNRILGSELSIVNLGNTPTFGIANNQFKTAYTYDANGNIETLKRYDGTNGGQLIDDISYQYNLNGAGKLENNQLTAIQDAVGSTANLGDIDNQTYIYDARGSIIQIVEPNNPNNRTTDITWLNTGKVKTVSIKEQIGGAMTEISHLEYLYDATGNRVAKIWKEVIDNPTTWKNTYYVCDASGNKMSIYNRGYEFTASSRLNPYRTFYSIQEQLLYGSDRIGSINNNTRLFTNNYTDLSTAESYAGWNVNTKLSTTNSTFDFGERALGIKAYDLVDHLGNVTMQLSDRKAGTIATNDIQANVLSYQQYFPFGWSQPGRSLNADKARFDFQNQETDKEWLGGNAVAYKYRFHDPRLGRFLSVDPLKDDYPWNSAYAFSENQVIAYIELEGLEKTESEANEGAVGGGASDASKDPYQSHGNSGSESPSPESGAQGESWWVRAAKWIGRKGAGVVGLMLEPFETNGGSGMGGENGYIREKNRQLERELEEEKKDDNIYITLYRGTGKKYEGYGYEDLGLVLSEASQTSHFEGTKGSDLEMHEGLVEHFGSLEAYAAAHNSATSFTDGLTIGGQPAKRTLISFTDNIDIAHQFGKGRGSKPYSIYKIRVRKTDVIKSVNSGEGEYLLILKVKPESVEHYDESGNLIKNP